MRDPEDIPAHGSPDVVPERIEQVNGVELFVHELGPQNSGVPLVVIHGGPDWDHSYLLPGVEPVASHRRVIMFDMRGCGRSSVGLGDAAYQPEFVVEDIRQLVSAIGSDPVDILGFSTGGQVAQLLVDQHPDIVRKLVLASTTAYPDMSVDTTTLPEAAARASLQPAWPGWAPSPRPSTAQGRDLTIQWAIDGAPRAIWNLDRMDEYLALLGEVGFTGEWIRPFQAGKLHTWRPEDPEATLRNFGGPVLVLHGAEDMGFPVQTAMRLVTAVANARLQIIKRAGHMAQFDQSDAWASAVLDFLN